MCFYYIYSFFFFNDTATTEIYTLSLHDALPIYRIKAGIRFNYNSRALIPEGQTSVRLQDEISKRFDMSADPIAVRSEEHTSELQSRQYLVCRLLLEKKKKIYNSL